MKLITKQKWITWTALLLSLPTAYFFLINILKDQFGVNGPYDATDPILQDLGISESPGWNINLLIFLGPLAALFLSIFQVLRMKWKFTKEQIEFHFAIRRSWFPLLVAAFSISLLAILFLYLLGENCNCQYR
ncbi:MAG: hypothetical protein ACHQFX_06260 [Chitinophagales bacterium]